MNARFIGNRESVSSLLQRPGSCLDDDRGQPTGSGKVQEFKRRLQNDPFSDHAAHTQVLFPR